MNGHASLAPAAQIASALSDDAALIRRACDALDSVHEFGLQFIAERRYAYASALSLDDALRVWKHPHLDHAARDAQLAKRKAS